MAADRDTRATILRVDRALPQLVSMVRSEHGVVATKACEVLWQLAEEPGAAAAMADAAVGSAARKVLAAGDRRSRVATPCQTLTMSRWLPFDRRIQHLSTHQERRHETKLCRTSQLGFQH